MEPLAAANLPASDVGTQFNSSLLPGLLLSPLAISAIYFLIYLFIYLRERERERASAGGKAEAEGEAGSLLSREPKVGLDPKTPRSGPEPKADA